MSLINIKANLSKSFHIAPSEIDMMPMWEFELYIKSLNDLVEEENKNNQAEMDKYHVNEYMNMSKPKNIQKMTQTPNFSKFNIGNLNNTNWK